MKSASGNAKQNFVPVALISGAIFATAVLMWLMSKSSLVFRTFDFSLLDTYFIVGWTYLTVPLFLVVTFILFFTRELVASQNRTGKTITLVSGILIFLFGSFLIGNDVHVYDLNSNWMALPPGIEPGDLSRLFNYKIRPIVVGSQMILFFAMMYLAFKWGRSSKPH